MRKRRRKSRHAQPVIHTQPQDLGRILTPYVSGATNTHIVVIMIRAGRSRVRARVTAAESRCAVPTAERSRKVVLTINYQRQNNTFLYVSSDDPHKNHKKLIEAWCLLSEEDIYPKLILTIDKNTSLHSSIIKKVEKNSLNIDIFPNLERLKILNLYKQSTALIFPSFFESYGLPLVEANHYDLPVIASELDFVRDILDPVETFDPNSSKSISRSVKRFLKIKEKKTEVVKPEVFIKSVINL